MPGAHLANRPPPPLSPGTLVPPILQPCRRSKWYVPSEGGQGQPWGVLGVQPTVPAVANHPHSLGRHPCVRGSEHVSAQHGTLVSRGRGDVVGMGLLANSNLMWPLSRAQTCRTCFAPGTLRSSSNPTAPTSLFTRCCECPGLGGSSLGPEEPSGLMSTSSPATARRPRSKWTTGFRGCMCWLWGLAWAETTPYWAV